MDTLFISKYMVLKSAAGYYIGRYCYEHMGGGKNDWCLQPYDRDSGYTQSEDTAKEWLTEYDRVESPEVFEARFIVYRDRFHKQQEQ